MTIRKDSIWLVLLACGFVFIPLVACRDFTTERKGWEAARQGKYYLSGIRFSEKNSPDLIALLGAEIIGTSAFSLLRSLCPIPGTKHD